VTLYDFASGRLENPSAMHVETALRERLAFLQAHPLDEAGHIAGLRAIYEGLLRLTDRSEVTRLTDVLQLEETVAQVCRWGFTLAAEGQQLIVKRADERLGVIPLNPEGMRLGRASPVEAVRHRLWDIVSPRSERPKVGGLTSSLFQLSMDRVREHTLSRLPPRETLTERDLQSGHLFGHRSLSREKWPAQHAALWRLGAAGELVRGVMAEPGFQESTRMVPSQREHLLANTSFHTVEELSDMEWAFVGPMVLGYLSAVVAFGLESGELRGDEADTPEKLLAIMKTDWFSSLMVAASSDASGVVMNRLDGETHTSLFRDIALTPESFAFTRPNGVFTATLSARERSNQAERITATIRAASQRHDQPRSPSGHSVATGGCPAALQGMAISEDEASVKYLTAQQLERLLDSSRPGGPLATLSESGRQVRFTKNVIARSVDLVAEALGRYFRPEEP
jgi:hypothetical protein